jgi:hypothetical protein
MAEPEMGIIGRERALIDALGRLVLAALNKHHDYTPLRETRRGTEFEVAIRGPDDEPTGRVARISIELQAPTG